MIFKRIYVYNNYTLSSYVGVMSIERRFQAKPKSPNRKIIQFPNGLVNTISLIFIDRYEINLIVYTIIL